jgi:hypothetical protein
VSIDPKSKQIADQQSENALIRNYKQTKKEKETIIVSKSIGLFKLR